MSEEELLAMASNTELSLDEAARVLDVSHTTLRRRAGAMNWLELTSDGVTLHCERSSRPIRVSAEDRVLFLNMLSAEPTLKSANLRRLAARWRASNGLPAPQKDQGGPDFTRPLFGPQKRT
jgi:hypothetical protein